MGSFYATCSISRQTICDGQEVYVQFMLPNEFSKDISIGEYFVKSFLNVVEEDGLEKAIENWKKVTSTWGKDSELSPKGLLVSNDGAFRKWVPFGPAIRGEYDDCGDIVPKQDEDSQRRVKILEGLMGLPFRTIQEAAQDKRWFTLGLGEYRNEEDRGTDWKPKGIHKDMPEWQLTLCKKLSLTYFHAAVYDEVSSFDFTSDEKNGIMKCDYSTKWKNDHLEKLNELPKIFEMILKVVDSDMSTIEEINFNRLTCDIAIFRYLQRELGLIYLSVLARENASIDWIRENILMMYSLSGMNIILNQSEYGSQQNNFHGWKRINSALNIKIDEYIKDYEEDND